ncbi:minor tail protein [Propionibacterium phage Anatole]|uniref:Uncharacterized protein n=3 Tax=Anatolevirus TaxID=2169651 RepID=A0A1D8ET89_9CAUD|nr:minor tail protein [Propionibacterium phage Anatole]YP_009596883.1 minor tail protein [Propionibacterium phage B3]AOT24258.1 hypothetical protein ANATOLE_19 [Propionibacterium phage Anatole]AOT24313.1 minor tail protein [Propionibacterium phage B3]AOT24493.1 minor tail protein [Propionibacterium phage E1]
MVDVFRGLGVAGWDAGKQEPLGVVTPSEHRRSVQMLAAWQGCFASAGMLAELTALAGSTKVKLGAGQAAISAPNGGWYLPSWPATTLDVGSGAAQDRIVTITVTQRDYEVDASALTSPAVISVLTGTASATPQPPVVPSGALALWQIRVPAGASDSSSFVRSRVHLWTAPVGGTVPMATATDLARHGGVPVGTRAQICDTGDIWQLTGTGWFPDRPVGQLVHLQDSAAPSGVLPLINAGSVVVHVDSNGFGGFNFDPPFPSHLTTVVASSGDSRAHDGPIADGSLLSDRWMCRFHAPGRSNVPVRVNFVAVGF